MATPKRAAIVTGGSGGIGKAVVLRLAADGFVTVVNNSGTAATAEGIVSKISFLAGPDGGWVNAQTLRANGGFV